MNLNYVKIEIIIYQGNDLMKSHTIKPSAIDFYLKIKEKKY